MNVTGLLLDLDPCYPSAFFFLLIFWIFVVLLGVDCCLLRYNPEFMLAIVNLNMLCFYCDCGMPEKPLQYLHLMLLFSPNEKIHWWFMMWSFLWEPYYLFFAMLCSMLFSSLFWLLFVLGPCSMHGWWEGESGLDCKLWQGYVFSKDDMNVFVRNSLESWERRDLLKCSAISKLSNGFGKVKDVSSVACV